jgi:valyl-tRNA synthetase
LRLRDGSPVKLELRRQWIYRRAKRDVATALLLDDGTRWTPESMRKRFRAVMSELPEYWILSRHHSLGISFPVWYPTDQDGVAQDDRPVFAASDALPVEPWKSEVPAKGGEAFVRDPDVFTPWAASSITTDLVRDLYPAEKGLTDAAVLRFLSVESIDNWLVHSYVRKAAAADETPFGEILVCGRSTSDPTLKNDRLRHEIETIGPDGMRYWACHASSGSDAAYDSRCAREGRRLAIKLLNITAVVRQFVEAPSPSFDVCTDPADITFCELVKESIGDISTALRQRRFPLALFHLRGLITGHLSTYLSLVKTRLDSAERTRSTRAALALGWAVATRAAAPILPFVTEECWAAIHDTSVHIAPWPGGELAGVRTRDKREKSVIDTAHRISAAVRRLNQSDRRAIVRITWNAGEKRPAAESLAVDLERLTGCAITLAGDAAGREGAVIAFGDQVRDALSIQ